MGMYDGKMPPEVQKSLQVLADFVLERLVMDNEFNLFDSHDVRMKLEDISDEATDAIANFIDWPIRQQDKYVDRAIETIADYEKNFESTREETDEEYRARILSYQPALGGVRE